eukprot:Amastigsp_a177844_4.p3 type:complete len:157 gc:universal Amastigsp_a177844_4:845-375(-)
MSSETRAATRECTASSMERCSRSRSVDGSRESEILLRNALTLATVASRSASMSRGETRSAAVEPPERVAGAAKPVACSGRVERKTTVMTAKTSGTRSRALESSCAASAALDSEPLADVTKTRRSPVHVSLSRGLVKTRFARATARRNVTESSCSRS